MTASLVAIRRAAGYALDDLEVYNVANGATSTTVVIGRLTNPTTGASTERYNGRHIYCESGVAVQQRRVRTGGYIPVSGTLPIEPVWSVIPVAVTDDVELTGLFPSAPDGPRQDTDYRTLINRALARLLVEDETTIAITGSDEYSLAAVPGMDRPGRLRYIREPSPISGRAPVSSDFRGWRLELDGETPRLRCRAPFDTVSGDLTLGIFRPADTWVKPVASGVWATSTVGLINDLDEVVPDVESVLTAFLVEAYRALMTRNVGRPTGQWAEKYEPALADAKRLRNYDHTIEAPTAQPAEEAA